MRRTAQEKLEEIGIDAICARIENGETFSEIAKSVGCDISVVSRWLSSDETRYQLSARARALSAEAWLDRGLDPLRQALDKGGNIDAAAARAYAQECARRAALRNPAYREKSEVKHSGSLSLSQMSDEELERRARGEA